MIEAGVVIGLDHEVLTWHLPPGRSGGALPDSPDLWSYLWEHRSRVLGFAHSHPGGGLPGPSHEDVTTFAAVEAALGRRLSWWITSSERVCIFHWRGPEKYAYWGDEVVPEPEWVAGLRELSK